MTVCIAGAGIGGLTAALSLHQVGIDVQIFEAVREIRPLGVGINLLPQAVRELDDLGLLPALERAGIATGRLCYFSKHGREIWCEPRGRAAGYSWPQISIHRGLLQSLLLQAVKDRIGAEQIVTGTAMRRWSAAPNGVIVEFRDRTEDEEFDFPLDFSCFVAADGIHSQGRKRLFPGEGLPLWNGSILWRGVTRARPFLDGATMAQIGHSRQKFVTYPIIACEDGTQIINWVAELKFETSRDWNREDWNREGRLEDFLPAFADWRFDWLDVPALIESADAVFEYPMVDRDPLPHWTHGAMTLLGDAAHPMYPIGSNGASQAILDARVLAREMAWTGETADALSAYEKERRPATAAIVEANRKNGPDEVLDIVEDRAPDGFDDLSDVIATDELEEVAARYKALAGFSIEAINAAPPIVPETVKV